VQPSYSPLPRPSLKLTSSSSPERLPNLLDGDPTTYWGAGSKLLGELVIELPRPTRLGRLSFEVTPRGVRFVDQFTYWTAETAGTTESEKVDAFVLPKGERRYEVYFPDVVVSRLTLSSHGILIAELDVEVEQ
jgi:hypothetical protein